MWVDWDTVKSSKGYFETSLNTIFKIAHVLNIISKQ